MPINFNYPISYPGPFVRGIGPRWWPKQNGGNEWLWQRLVKIKPDTFLTVFATKQFPELLTISFTMQSVNVRVDYRRNTSEQHQRVLEPAAYGDILVSDQ